MTIAIQVVCDASFVVDWSFDNQFARQLTEQWLQAQLRHSIAQATQSGWILDCDTTSKYCSEEKG